MKVFCILVAIVMVSEVAARRAATRQASPDEYQPESKAYGMPYNFGYSVYHPPSYNDYGHQETSDGKRVDGEYRVALPDGRTQIVTYYVEGDSGFQAKVRYEPTVNGPPPSTPYEGPEPHHEARRPAYAPVHEPRRPHYPPPYEPQRPLYSPPQESLYRPKEPEYPPAHLHKKPFYVETPTESSEVPVDEEEPSTVSPPVIEEPKSEPEPISEGRRPHDGYSENPSAKPYTRPNPYPQGYVPYAQREHPQPHDGYSPKLYKQFQGDYGRRIQPHDGYSPKPYNERKEEYTPNLPHDGYSPKLYNEPKEAYPTKPYRHEGYPATSYEGSTPKPYPPRIAEDYPPRRLPHSGYTKSNEVSEEQQPTRPSHPRYHDGYLERHPHRELKPSVEVGERKPHTGYPDDGVTHAGRPTSEKRRRSQSPRKVRQRYVQTNLRRVQDVRERQPSQRRLVRMAVQPYHAAMTRQ
ncbi:uncharacterized protein LOC130689890 [Daphnia carinata]|uniref:uncharacterized protein LOC130689890 n=1 Tax=Daphnia carinata TaxID=120202 RepID=UPI00257E857E|nr:uncharacterized protein LOC130689890 [Daphnia carinata]